ncbi:MmcB family DNA repair protein [Algihabitans sp.]|uniref:MmcB family DNA repair protein n=1 Tax=Algihabitans sp. TaxID=2821514 RepID=UPI003BA8B6EA
MRSSRQRHGLGAANETAPSLASNVTDHCDQPLTANRLTQEVTRGVARLFDAMGFASLPEVPLANGRRLDLLALGEGGALWAVEIKTSIADFRGDRKWPDYLEFCERLYFAVPLDFPQDILPMEQGLIVADAYDARILRNPGDRKLPAARRKALTLRFARLAAKRLLYGQPGYGQAG